MIRVLLVIGGIAVVFVVTLVVGGNVLGAWEPAKPATAPAPRAAERTPRGLVEVKTPSRSQAPRRRTPSRPSWVAQLDALCRSAEAEALLTAPPGSVAELKESLKKSARMSARWNGAAAKLLALAAPTHSRSVRRLRQLFVREGRLIARATAALDAGDLARLQRLAPRLIATGREQSRLLVGLGAKDCAVPDYMDI